MTTEEIKSSTNSKRSVKIIFRAASILSKEKKMSQIPLPDAFGGLDLSRVADMSAFCLAIPQGVKIKIKVLLWIPEVYAKAHNHLAPFVKWAEQGFLTLTPGNTMDYTWIRRDIRKLCKDFNVLNIAYDPMYAESLTQELVDGVYNADTGEILEDGIGCERTIFAQTTAGYAQPTSDFLSLILDGNLIHENNACLNWQAMNLEVQTDAFGNNRPIKPGAGKGEENSYKKIDGMVAAIMAYSLALRHIESLNGNVPSISFI